MMLTPVISPTYKSWNHEKGAGEAPAEGGAGLKDETLVPEGRLYQAPLQRTPNLEPQQSLPAVPPMRIPRLYCHMEASREGSCDRGIVEQILHYCRCIDISLPARKRWDGDLVQRRRAAPVMLHLLRCSKTNIRIIKAFLRLFGWSCT
jgi:hypothetical protein